MDQDPAQSFDSAQDKPMAAPEANPPEQTTSTVRDLLVWRSPSRPPIVFDRELYATAVSICLLLSVIVAFFQEWMLIVLIWGALFLLVALSKRPPEEVEHKITTQGIVSLGQVHLWESLGPFWFTQKSDHQILHILQQGNFFGTLLLVIPQGLSTESVRDTLAKYLPFIEVPEKSRTDRLTEWFTGKLSQNSHRNSPSANSGKVI